MPKISLSRDIPYDCLSLLDLAGDVENYPKFIPYIKAVRIWNKNSDASGFCAELMIGYKNFRVPFSTKVSIDKTNKTIITNNIESNKTGFLKLKSPIKYLKCIWSFNEIENATNVKINIDLEFSDFILGSLVGANLEKATNYLINAFETEAHKRFGSKI